MWKVIVCLPSLEKDKGHAAMVFAWNIPLALNGCSQYMAAVGVI